MAGIVPKTTPVSGGSSEVDSSTAQLTKVTKLLQAAGASAEAIQIVGTNPSLIDLIDSHPGLAKFWADRYPDLTSNQHQAVEATEFGTSIATAQAGYTDPYLSGSKGLQSDLAKELKNGVIVQTDPATGTKSVLFPDDPDGKIPGSPAWTAKVVDWKPQKVRTWRNTLEKQGYLSQGASEAQFISALAAYHQDRYIYGRPLKAGAGDTQPKLRDAIDKSEIRQAVRQQMLATFGDPGTDDEVEQWTSWFQSKANQLIDKGYTPEHAATAAAARVQNKVEGSPEGKLFMQQAQEEEENTQLRDSLLSIGQVVAG